MGGAHRKKERKRKKKKLWEYLHTVTLIITKDADALVCMLSAALTAGEKQELSNLSNLATFDL